MSVKKETAEEVKFWTINIVLTIAAILFFYLLRNLDFFAEKSAITEFCRSFGAYGYLFAISRLLMMTVFYLLRGKRSIIRKGAVNFMIGEAIALIILFSITSLSVVWGIVIVILSNAITILSVYSHERILV